MMVGGFFYDLKKAFDCVNHKILLTKLEFYGITGITYKLTESDLGGRYQRVVLNNHSSSLPSTNYPLQTETTTENRHPFT
jgi:hypothetical protein